MAAAAAADPDPTHRPLGSATAFCPLTGMTAFRPRPDIAFDAADVCC